MNMRVLVLGGNGFIGSHLVEALVAGGAHVRVLTRSGCQCPPSLHGVEYRYADFVADSVSVAESLVDVDLVVHLISTTVPATANMDPLADINGNLLPTVRLLQQMRDQGVSRLVFLSSGGTVYGDTQSIPIPEEHERNPVSSYGIVKVAIENYIAMFSAQHGLQSLVLRVSNPYGPRQGHLGVQGVIPTFFQRIITGDEIRIWGDGSSVRDYLYVSDLVSFVVGGINEDLSGVYNVGSGQGVSLKDVLSLIEEISGVSANVKYLSPRGFDVKKVVLDISKARKALDWEPLVPLREGCERYWKWAKG
ncbi:MAG: NAD-dependent epimerase/dehydratase family protein [Desulfocapsaceae bacterium]|jgi:UDP-glucose 4-epimerase|nr:NAD-dependent epimerase/dehydratase family protein [Desulfocapsaceae bacterium]